MSTFEILCVTMHQRDFSKIKDMNIHSDVVFANQADTTSYEEAFFENHIAKMITTETRGVGKNRNTGLLYASADICLLADDDVTYRDDLEEVIVNEFHSCPDADVIIFHLDTDSQERKQRSYSKTRRHGRLEKMPWGGCRIAFRLKSVRKANLWFSTLFGGGCKYPSGEDSIWLTQAKRAGLRFYVSNKTIGEVSFDDSSWFSGADERFYFGKGAFYQAVHTKTRVLWMLYFAYRTKTMTSFPLRKRVQWMRNGAIGYQKTLSYNEYCDRFLNKK